MSGCRRSRTTAATARPSTSELPSSSDSPFNSALTAKLAIAGSMSHAADRRQLILADIAAAAKLARREPADITLIAVSKMHTAAEIEPLIEAGQRDFGESRVQEALA